jgi:hypothetical protein
VDWACEKGFDMPFWTGALTFFLHAPLGTNGLPWPWKSASARGDGDSKLEDEEYRKAVQDKFGRWTISVHDIGRRAQCSETI